MATSTTRTPTAHDRLTRAAAFLAAQITPTPGPDAVRLVAAGLRAGMSLGYYEIYGPMDFLDSLHGEEAERTAPFNEAAEPDLDGPWGQEVARLADDQRALAERLMELLELRPEDDGRVLG
jgi:hypothetical protein